MTLGARPSNVILSIEGLKFTEREAELFKAIKPLGVILFSRNIDNHAQLTDLCNSIRYCLGSKALILIDQEGGRVRRIKFGHGQDMVAPANLIAEKIAPLSDSSKQAIFNQYHACGLQLQKYGINVNCAPLADIQYHFADKIMGDRTFGDDIDLIVECCNLVQHSLAQSNVQGVIKHMPGHGRALVDSHLKLPMVNNDLQTLESTDFAVFKKLNNAKFAMSAHIIYKAIDLANPATLSKKCVEYIRNVIRFKGILITDDLSMKALPGTPAQNFVGAIAAGCDIGLYCHGVFDEMQRIGQYVSEVDEKLYQKILNLDCFKNANVQSKSVSV